MKNFIDYERLEKLSLGNTDIGISLERKMMKLYEEGGEMAQAMLKYLGSENVSASTDGKDAKALVLEEGCDVLNVLLDIFNAMEFTTEECRAMFDKKLDKWESKVTASKAKQA